MLLSNFSVEMSAGGDSGGVASATATLPNGDNHHPAPVSEKKPLRPTQGIGAGPPKFCLPIQAVVHEYRMKHGLRHQDFFRYRGYCSRRLKHIRKTLKFTQSSHKKHFQKRPVLEDSIRLISWFAIKIKCFSRLNENFEAQLFECCAIKS